MDATMRRERLCARLRRGAGGAGLALVMAGLAACDGGGGGGGGGDVSRGASTIQGTVVSFSSGGFTFIPVHRTWGERVLAGVMEVMVPSAHAAIGGVEVRVAGASAVTAENGLFVISGVPPGLQEVVFRYVGATGVLMVDVPANSVVELQGVRVNNGRAEVNRIGVRGDPDADDDSRDDDVRDDDSRDDDVGDDDSRDDDIRDDDSRDDDGRDDDSRDDDSRDDDSNDDDSDDD